MPGRCCSTSTAICPKARAAIYFWCATGPRERYVLPGVSRQATIDLARQLEITFEEKDLDLYDAYTADECFLTSTSLCICGVRSLNGRSFAAGRVPGPVTERLIEAYKALVGCDFVAQYLRRLDG